MGLSLGLSMHPSMRLYWEVGRRGYQRFATYRAATVAGVLTNSAFGFLRAYVLLAVFASRTDIGGYDRADAVTYVFVGQGMLAAISLWGWWEVALAIRSGDIITQLSRPFDLQGYWLAQDLGRALYHSLFRGIPPFLLGALVFDLRLPHSPVIWLAFAMSVVLAVAVSFALRFIINLLAFWLFDYRGVGALAAGVWTFLSGFAVPIAFFPGSLRTVADWLPFRAFVQIPIDIFLGKQSDFDLVAVLALQAFWAVLLLALGRLVLSAAMRRVVIQGG